MLRWYLLFFLMCSAVLLPGQSTRKREFRAAWIASVAHIDWPEKSGMTAQSLKQSYVAMLDELAAHGMNAVIVQVRPTADSFYPSTLEPWSEYLAGQQGRAPEPYFNPMAFMIEEAHRRGLEFHAWFNPFRASTHAALDHLAASHPIKRHPQWFIPYGSRWYFDPGYPAARAFVLDVIAETVRHYDLDAVHFDDYFYPYRIAGEPFPDDASYAAFGRDLFPCRDDWRRDNVNQFVRDLAQRIKSVKPFVKFGISPFGVWRNDTEDPDGSATAARQTNYDDLFADVLYWLDQGWLDYLVPQVYWHRGFDLADYRILVPWWNQRVEKAHLYIGQGLYRVGQKNWEDPNELVAQLELNQSAGRVKGSVFFSAKHFGLNPLGVGGKLAKYYQHHALVPEMPWLDHTPPAPPTLQTVVKTAEGPRLLWQDSPANESAYYVIYRFAGPMGGDVDHAPAIVGKVRRQPYANQQFVDRGFPPRRKVCYAVTAVDRLHNESKPSNGLAVKLGRRGHVKILKNQPKITVNASER